MNLYTLSNRYMVATEAAEAPEYALGKPRRVTETKPTETERWVATGTPGYVKSTTTGAVKTHDGPMPVVNTKAPPWGPLIEPDEDDGACCVPKELQDTAMSAYLRNPKKYWKAIKSVGGLEGCCWLGEIPAYKRAAVIAALNALEA